MLLPLTCFKQLFHIAIRYKDILYTKVIFKERICKKTIRDNYYKYISNFHIYFNINIHKCQSQDSILEMKAEKNQG